MLCGSLSDDRPRGFDVRRSKLNFIRRVTTRDKRHARGRSQTRIHSRLTSHTADSIPMTTVAAAIKETYGSIAEGISQGSSTPKSCTSKSCTANCCSSKSCTSQRFQDPITRGHYSNDEAASIPVGAMQASLGCGNPTALVDISPGQTVLDLGSGKPLFRAYLTARRWD